MSKSNYLEAIVIGVSIVIIGEILKIKVFNRQ